MAAKFVLKAVVPLEEETELAEEGEECLLALLEGFLFFLDLLDADFFLSLTVGLFLSAFGSRLPGLVLCDFKAKEGGPPGGAVPEAFGKTGVICPSSKSESVCWPYVL